LREDYRIGSSAHIARHKVSRARLRHEHGRREFSRLSGGTGRNAARLEAFLDTRLGRGAHALTSIGAGLLVWQLLSLRFPPLFLPSPLLTLQAVGELWEDGT